MNYLRDVTERFESPRSHFGSTLPGKSGQRQTPWPWPRLAAVAVCRAFAFDASPVSCAPVMTANSASSGRLTIELPEWLAEVVLESGPLTSDEERMALTIRLSQENVLRGGGPFGGTVFWGERLVASGVNLVLGSGFSIAHAEIVALMAAQSALGGGASNLPPLTLFASTEPCCQCFGALVWAGVRRLVCGATTADAEAVGFDEGPKPQSWVKVLQQRGIAVSQGVLQTEARKVLNDYVARGGQIYGKPIKS